MPHGKKTEKKKLLSEGTEAIDGNQPYREYTICGARPIDMQAESPAPRYAVRDMAVLGQSEKIGAGC